MFEIQVIFESLYHLSQEYIWGFYSLVSLVVLAESALFFAFFLPGDSLLFFCGITSALAEHRIWLFELVLIVVTIIGYQVNFELAAWFNNCGYLNRFVHMDQYRQESEQFFKRHGFYSVVVARFVPIVRNMLPFVVGLSGMNRQTFIQANIIGGVLWVLVIMNVAYFFGSVEWVRQNFLLCLLAVILLSCLPVMIKLAKWVLGRREAL